MTAKTKIFAMILLLLGYGCDIESVYDLYNDQISVSELENLYNEGLDLNKSYSGGITLLMVASMRGREDIVSFLLEKGVDINKQEYRGNTALIFASLEGHNNIVDKLLEYETAIHRQNNNGNTALMVAAREGFNNIVISLLDAGADVHKRNNRLEEEFQNVLSVAMVELEQNGQNNNGNTALMLASMEGRNDVVNTLLGAGANVHDQNNNRDTALMLARREGYDNIVSILLAAGAENKRRIFFADCSCYEEDATPFGHDFVGYAQGTGLNSNEAWRDSRSKCPVGIGKDFITNPDSIIVLYCRYSSKIELLEEV